MQKTLWESNSFFFGFILELILIISSRKAAPKDKYVNMTLKSYPCYMMHIVTHGLFIYLLFTYFHLLYIFHILIKFLKVLMQLLIIFIQRISMDCA